jgi:putative membrane protein
MLAAVLLAVLGVLCLLTAWDPPAGRLNWLLEVGPGLAGIGVMVAVRRRFPFSDWVHWCVFLHMLVLIYGGYYTYAETPLGNWARDFFGWSRNHYDRAGHVALGVFPVFITREVLLRVTPLRPGGWFHFILLSIILAIAAFWEILEWWVAVLTAPEVGQAFLGSQGDVWDAQWDMLLALVGAAAVLPLGSRLHDRSISRIPGLAARSGASGRA